MTYTNVKIKEEKKKRTDLKLWLAIVKFQEQLSTTTWFGLILIGFAANWFLSLIDFYLILLTKN